MDNPFNITREEILDLAAQKLADKYTDDESLQSMARNEVLKRIKERVNPKVDEVLTAEMERLLSSTIMPVNMWGEKTGESITIRDALALRAKDFWQTKWTRKERSIADITESSGANGCLRRSPKKSLRTP